MVINYLSENEKLPNILFVKICYKIRSFGSSGVSRIPHPDGALESLGGGGCWGSLESIDPPIDRDRGWKDSGRDVQTPCQLLLLAEAGGKSVPCAGCCSQKDGAGRKSVSPTACCRQLPRLFSEAVQLWQAASRQWQQPVGGSGWLTEAGRDTVLCCTASDSVGGLSVSGGKGD